MNGEDDHLACPTAAEVAPYRSILEGPKAKRILGEYNFQCDAGNDTQVPLLSVLDGSAVGSRERKEGKGPAPTSEQLAAIEGKSIGTNKPRRKGLSPGAIAGVRAWPRGAGAEHPKWSAWQLHFARIGRWSARFVHEHRPPLPRLAAAGIVIGTIGGVALLAAALPNPRVRNTARPGALQKRIALRVQHRMGRLGGFLDCVRRPG